MAELRTLQAGDIPEIVEMIRGLHAESPRYSTTKYAPGKIAALCTAILEKKIVAEIFVATRGATIAGIFAGIISEVILSHDLMATDLTFYIKPEFRGGTLALRLIRAFEAWAIANGAQSLIVGSSTEVAAERTAMLYRALGYRDYGYSLIKYPRGGAHSASLAG